MTSAFLAINTAKNNIWLMCYFYSLRRKLFGLVASGGIANKCYFNGILHDSSYTDAAVCVQVDLDCNLYVTETQARKASRGAVALARCFILPARHRLGFCQSVNGKAVPPGELAEKAAPAGCEAGRVGRGHWVAHIPPYLSLLPRRNGCSDEGATGTDASRFDPDDDECLRAGHDGNQTPRKQSGCGTGVRPKLAAFT